jgi:S-DNA-T family DNA segregation ATPase FtsK/SpoIIIE
LVIAFAALTLYLLVCLLSYSQQDASWTFTGGSDDVRNLGGRFGAWFSDLVLHAFGYSAYLLPLIFGLLSWRTQRYQKDPPAGYARLGHTIGLVLAVLSACGLEHIHFAREIAGLTFEAGGWVGSLSGAWLLESFGIVGATVIFLVMLVAGVSWALDVSWFTIMDHIGKWACDGADWLIERCRTAFDLAQGVQSRRQRQEAVADLRKGLGNKPPLRIEPRIAQPKTGVRIYKEKQEAIPMFVEDKVPKGSLPPLELLDNPDPHDSGYSEDVLENMSTQLVKKLLDFNIKASVKTVFPGPVITRFEIDPAPGVKASQIVGLSRDLARALSVVSVRVVENIPGKTFIGLEVPNEEREVVCLLDGLASELYESSKSPLTLVLGKDISGQPVITDLCKMPHLLIAGTTGAGKSVCINALILSIVYKSTPEDVGLILVDPKMLELSTYDGIPHLLTPVVTEMPKAVNALRWCMNEMDRRFRLMSTLGVRNIVGYNRKVVAAAKAGRPIADPLFTPSGVEDESEPEPLDKMRYIVVVIDELADLLMVGKKVVEDLITRIAQRARAAGIHLVVATQRPSVDVVTGIIKANIPTRIAFQVSSRADSRTVLDQMGAEQLLGDGDMLFLPPGTGVPVRVHGSLVSDQEVHRVAEQLRLSGEPEYLQSVLEIGAESNPPGSELDAGSGEEDPLYDQALAYITDNPKRASISSVQRQLRVGYNRAARMIDAMEASGVIGPSQNGKREVLAQPSPQE